MNICTDWIENRQRRKGCGKPMIRAHCATCHENFGGEGIFDRHRTGDHNDLDRRCLTVEEMEAARGENGEPVFAFGGTFWSSSASLAKFATGARRYANVGGEGSEDEGLSG